LSSTTPQKSVASLPASSILSAQSIVVVPLAWTVWQNGP
jgi:hypothetical protein